MWLYYVIGKEDPRPNALCRMTPDGGTCEKFSWKNRKWEPDTNAELVGALVKGEVYLRKISEAEATLFKKI